MPEILPSSSGSPKSHWLIPSLLGIVTLGALLFLLFARNGSDLFKADVTGSADVNLQNVLLRMPGNNFFTNGDTALAGAQWIPGGYFAVSSFCTGTQNKTGLWVFSETGNALGQRDTCLDAGENASASAAHTWSVSGNMQPIGNGQFVKEMSNNNDRPPLLYQASASGVNLVSKAWPAPGPGGRRGNGTDATTNVAAIPGYAVALENNTTVVLYKLSDWSVSQRVQATPAFPTDAQGRALTSNPADQISSPLFTPLTGIGNYIVGWTIDSRIYTNTGSGFRSGGFTASLVLYEVKENSLHLVGKSALPVRTRTITDIHGENIGTQSMSALPTIFAVDASSQNSKIGIGFENDGGTGHNHVAIYKVASTGLTLDHDVVLPATGTLPSGLAIAGEYTAFVDCGLDPLPAPSSGAADFFNTRTCGLSVLKGTQTLKVQRLPYAATVSSAAQSTPVETLPPTLNSIAISTGGSILATSYYGAYLYKIANFPTSNPNPNGGQNGNGNNPARTQCQQAGGNGCTVTVLAGETQFGARNANGCTQDTYCVGCAQGYTWNGQSPGDCRNTALCTDTAVGGNGCTFTVGTGEVSLGDPGAYGCTGAQPYCVRCASGTTWNGANCIPSPQP